MAEGKKSVLLYCDLIHTIEKMDNETAGQFFKHYLRYINDLNPETDNLIVDLTFESVKQNLKRDLKKWENRAEKSRENGKKGGRPLKEETQETQQVNLKPKKPVKDTVNVTVTDTVNVNVNDILLEKETKELFNLWLDYRKEIKKPIKSEKTLKSLAEKIQSEGYQKSKLIINNSIQNGWQGLFWDKVTFENQKSKFEKGQDVFLQLMLNDPECQNDPAVIEYRKNNNLGTLKIEQ